MQVCQVLRLLFEGRAAARCLFQNTELNESRHWKLEGRPTSKYAVKEIKVQSESWKCPGQSTTFRRDARIQHSQKSFQLEKQLAEKLIGGVIISSAYSSIERVPFTPLL